MITQRIAGLDRLVLPQTLPNEEAARDFLQWATARQIAAWADKHKDTWDKTIKPRLNEELGKHLIHDSAFVTVEQNNLMVTSPVNEAKLRVAMANAGIDTAQADAIITASRGQTMQRRFNYTIKV